MSLDQSWKDVEKTEPILNRDIKIRTMYGALINMNLTAYESPAPYRLLLVLEQAKEFLQLPFKVKVTKDELARELRRWLDGHMIRNPCVLIPKRIDESVTKFVKFGKPPPQEDLLVWILSRTELRTGDDSEIKFGGFEFDYTGIKSIDNEREEIARVDAELAAEDDAFAAVTLKNEYPKTTRATKTTKSKIITEDINDPLDDLEEFSKSIHNLQDLNVKANSASARPSSAPGGLKTFMFPGPDVTAADARRDEMAHLRKMHRENAKASKVDNSSYGITRKIVGRSKVMEDLKAKGSTKLKGREGAQVSVSKKDWTSDHWRLAADLDKARKDVEKAMEERRMMIVTSKIRQKQMSDKLNTVKQKINGSAGSQKWVADAEEELIRLKNIHFEVQEDIRKQKIKSKRAVQQVAMIIAPPGYTNRRGSWQRGAVIGPGPLPPDATMPQTDPLLDLTMKKYYWDSEGRRHMRTLADIEREESSKSGVDRAMEVIRRAAANATTYKLDLKKIFEYFDTSGDGHIVKSELIQAFEAMGVKLDAETAAAIFDHFDPNHSGSIRLGEFVYAFFNRRKMVRQYKRSINGLTEQQVKAKFHACDNNGNGKLDHKEFQKLLKKFGIEIAEFEHNLMMEKFDTDDDGCLDLDEFRDFLNNPDGELTTKIVKSKTLPPAFSRIQHMNVHNNTAPAALIEESKYSSEDKQKSIDMEKVDVLWMAKMLEEQEKMESKLGKEYYRN